MTARQSNPTADPILCGLELLCEPGGVHELRVPKAGRARVISGYFDDWEALAKAAEQLSGRVPGVYFTANPVPPALLARAQNRVVEHAELTTSDDAVARRRWLILDLDPTRPAGISASEKEHGAAIQRAREIVAHLRGQGWPTPLAMDSGNGCYLLYRVDLANDEASRELVRRCLEALAFQHDDDQVHVDQTMFNAARIIRIPGTLNAKGDDTPERPHRTSRLLSPGDGELVSAELLTGLAGRLPEEPSSEQNGQRVYAPKEFDLGAFVREHLQVARESTWSNGGYRWVLEACPFNSDHTDHSAWVARRSSGAIVAGCQHDSCRWDWKELRQKYEPGYREQRQQWQEKQAPGRSKAQPGEPAEPAEPVELAAIPEYPVSALTRGLRDLVEEADRASLPPGLAAAAGLGALAAAIGPHASIRMDSGWEERAILWPVLMAPRGAGKSPSQDLAFGPLRAHDAEVHGAYLEEVAAWRQEKSAERGPAPIDPTILAGDLNLESMARLLRGRPALAIDADELQQWILGLGEYKNRGGSGDRGRVLKLWSGQPWRFTRVGADGHGVPAIDILVPGPTVTICGGLQPELSHLLGGEQDGLRPRWLLHLAAMPQRASSTVAAAPEGWLRLIAELLLLRDKERRWDLSPAARRVFQAQRELWKQQARSTESASVSAALDKADRHLLRVTLDLAEAEHPAQGGEVPKWMVERGIAAVEFTIDSWRALPEQSGLALSVKDERLDHGVDRLLAWLEQHGGRATKRELLRAAVAGARTAADLDQLLQRYAAVYPGTIRQEAPPTGGPVATVIYAPRRSPRIVSADNDRVSPEDGKRPSAEYKTGGADNGADNDLAADNVAADNVAADKPQVCRHSVTATAYGVTKCLKCGKAAA